MTFDQVLTSPRFYGMKMEVGEMTSNSAVCDEVESLLIASEKAGDKKQGGCMVDDGGWPEGGKTAKAGAASPSDLDVDAKDENSRTELHRATRNRQKHLVESLIERGADVNAQDRFGWTPLHYAADEGFSDVATVLLRNGACANTPDTKGFIPLDYARANNHTESTRILGKAAEVHRRGPSGRSPDGAKADADPKRR
jgi:ankyrin repeat protein